MCRSAFKDNNFTIAGKLVTSVLNCAGIATVQRVRCLIGMAPHRGHCRMPGLKRDSCGASLAW